MPGELVIVGAGAKRSLWKRNVQVLFTPTIFGEEFAFQAVQDTEGEFCCKSKAGGQGIQLGKELILFFVLPQLPIHLPSHFLQLNVPCSRISKVSEKLNF